MSFFKYSTISSLCICLLFFALSLSAQKYNLNGYFKFKKVQAFGTISMKLIQEGDQLTGSFNWEFDKSVSVKQRTRTGKFTGTYNPIRDLYILTSEDGDPKNETSWILFRKTEDGNFVGVSRIMEKNKPKYVANTIHYYLNSPSNKKEFSEIDFASIRHNFVTLWYEKETDRLIVMSDWSNWVGVTYRHGSSSSYEECRFTSENRCEFDPRHGDGTPYTKSGFYNAHFTYLDNKTIEWDSNKWRYLNSKTRVNKKTILKNVRSEGRISDFNPSGEWRYVSGRYKGKDGILSFTYLSDRLFYGTSSDSPYSLDYYYEKEPGYYICNMPGLRGNGGHFRMTSKNTLDFHNSFDYQGVYHRFNPDNIKYSPSFYSMKFGNSDTMYLAFYKNNRVEFVNSSPEFPLSKAYITLKSKFDYYRKGKSISTYRINGENLYFTVNGREYSGKVDSDGNIHSTQDFKLYNFGSKVGCVLGDCDDGKGIKILNDKGIYEGDMAHGTRNGYGIYHQEDGFWWHVGEWTEDKRNGFGNQFSLTKLPSKLDTKKTFKGYWVNGNFISSTKPTAEEIKKFSRTCQITAFGLQYEGLWDGECNDGIVTGDGKFSFTNSSGSKFIWEGTFDGGNPVGKIKKTSLFRNGDKEVEYVNIVNGKVDGLRVIKQDLTNGIALEKIIISYSNGVPDGNIAIGFAKNGQIVKINHNGNGKFSYSYTDYGDYYFAKLIIDSGIKCLAYKFGNQLSSNSIVKSIIENFLKKLLEDEEFQVKNLSKTALKNEYISDLKKKGKEETARSIEIAELINCIFN